MNPVPVICFDLDGTLLDAAGRIHPQDRRWLTAPEPPAVLVPCTGRPIDGIKRAFADNGLFVDQSLPFPLVLQNGALLFRPGERRCAHIPFSAETQARLIELVMDFPQVTTLLLDALETHMLYPNPFGLQAIEHYDFTVVPFLDDSRSRAFSKVMCLSDDPQALRAVQRASTELDVEGAYSMPIIFELAPPGVSKASGLQRLLDILDMGDSRLLAAGDGQNDRALLELADQSFAPASAPEEIRRLAQQVIDVPAAGLLGPMLGQL